MIREYEFSTLKDGRKVMAYEISNSFGEKATILNYGATIASLVVLDKDGNLKDVVLGANENQDVENTPYMAQVMGRCGNRIAYGTFEIDGHIYHLDPMEGPHHLHGAKGNFAKQLFEAVYTDHTVSLHYFDDGKDGWENPLDVTIRYTFDDSHALSLEYQCLALGDTIVSPTNHAYFNLNAPSDVLDTKLMIHAKNYAPKSSIHMPDGRLESVENTPLDFTSMKSLKDALKVDENFFPEYQDSFDDFYQLDDEGFKEAAVALNEQSGIMMKVFTDAPTIILYTPVVKEEVVNKNDLAYKGHIAFCLETQYMPNAINCDTYPKPVFHNREIMRSRTIFAFSRLK